MTDYSVLNLIPEDVIELCKERAAYGEFDLPTTPGEYLMWIEDEMEIQNAVASTAEDFNGEARKYADYLDSLASVLRAEGVRPTLPPWVLRDQFALENIVKIASDLSGLPENKLMAGYHVFSNGMDWFGDETAENGLDKALALYDEFVAKREPVRFYVWAVDIDNRDQEIYEDCYLSFGPYPG